MDIATRWRRTDAELWVWVLCLVHAVLITLAALLVGVWALVWRDLLLGVLAVLLPVPPAVLTSAWRRGHPWTWWVLTPLVAIALLAGLGYMVAAVSPSAFGAAGLVLDGSLLLMLCHPASRARIEPALEYRATAPLGLSRAAAVARPWSSGRTGC